MLASMTWSPSLLCSIPGCFRRPWKGMRQINSSNVAGQNASEVEFKVRKSNQSSRIVKEAKRTNRAQGSAEILWRSWSTLRSLTRRRTCPVFSRTAAKVFGWFDHSKTWSIARSQDWRSARMHWHAQSCRMLSPTIHRRVGREHVFRGRTSF